MKSVKIILHAARCTQIIVKIEIIMPRPAPHPAGFFVAV